MASINKKTVRVDPKYSGNASNNSGYNSTYVGFVVSNDDPTKMGKLDVWIPSINKNKDFGTFSVSYASPFAGSSNMANGAQTSYGFWAVPPDINNQVIVMFIEGDPNKGIWLGCLYQQNMNNMVPGIPNATIVNQNNVSAPASEYDKNDINTASTSADPPRPIYEPLNTGLNNQGLTGDAYRGTSTSSARRDDAASVIGMLSPGGSQFVMDDNPSNEFVRLRTKGGAQVLINDTIGMVYIISKNGNSWVEVSDTAIDVYSSQPVSVRSQGDINMHSDTNINMFAVNSINMTAVNGVNIASEGATNMIAGSQFNINSAGQTSIVSNAALVMTSGGALGIDSGGDLALRGCGSIGISCCNDMVLKGSKTTINSGSPVTPGNANLATAVQVSSIQDIEVSLSDGYPEIKTKSIVTRLPSHEPYSGHPTSPTASSTIALNQNVSARVEQGDSGFVPTDKPSDIKPGDVVQDPNLNATPNDQQWWIPVTGTITSLYNDRSAAVHATGHPGIDIGAPSGTNIMASRKGTVIFAAYGKPGSYGGYGNCVVIDHGDGYVSIYGHMVKLGCKATDVVSQGQTIGFVGTTPGLPYSTGNHCHFEVRKSGNRIDPSTLIPQLGKKMTRVQAGPPKS